MSKKILVIDDEADIRTFLTTLLEENGYTTCTAENGVEGYAVAGGLELACWCDMRVAARDAVFGVYCRRWGMPLADGGTVRLTRIVGQGDRKSVV